MWFCVVWVWFGSGVLQSHHDDPRKSLLLRGLVLRLPRCGGQNLVVLLWMSCRAAGRSRVLMTICTGGILEVGTKRYLAFWKNSLYSRRKLRFKRVCSDFLFRQCGVVLLLQQRVLFQQQKFFRGSGLVSWIWISLFQRVVSVSGNFITHFIQQEAILKVHVPEPNYFLKLAH